MDLDMDCVPSPGTLDRNGCGMDRLSVRRV